MSLLKQINKKNKTIDYGLCPSCSVIIEKNEGCNHLKCINCEYQFCWLCKEEYTEDHYDFYNFIGCPGMRYSNID